MSAAWYRSERPTLPGRLRSRAQRLAFERLLLNLKEFENENVFDYAVRERTPAAWATLEEDIDVTERRVKVTLLLDESVARFYRAMGRGYQARIDRVLATYAQMRIADVKRAEKAIEEWDDAD